MLTNPGVIQYSNKYSVVIIMPYISIPRQLNNLPLWICRFIFLDKPLFLSRLCLTGMCIKFLIKTMIDDTLINFDIFH